MGKGHEQDIYRKRNTQGQKHSLNQEKGKEIAGLFKGPISYL